MQEMHFQSLGQEHPLEKEMATHSSILTWRIPWTEEPGRLQSMGLQKSQAQLSDKKKKKKTPKVNHHLCLQQVIIFFLMEGLASTLVFAY